MNRFLTSRLNLAAALIFFGSLVALYFTSRQQRSEAVIGYIEKNLVATVKRTEAQVQLLISRVLNQPNWDNTGLSEDAHLFLIRNGQVIWWSDNRVWPVTYADSLWTYYRLPSGHFLIKRFDVFDDTALVAVIPLQWSYRIQNEYLKPSFNRQIFGRYQVSLAESGSQSMTVRMQNRPVFYVYPFSGYTHLHASLIVVTGLALIVFALSLWVSFYRQQRIPALYIFIGWCALLFLIRWAMLAFRFPAGYIDSSVFDPKYFASSRFNPSLADLLFNSIAVLTASTILFRYYHRFWGILRLLKHKTARFPILLFSAVAVYFGWLYPYVVVQTIYNNSAIPIGISESLSFDYLRIIAYAVLVASWISAFQFVHVWTRLLMTASSGDRLNFALGGLLIFSAINLLTGQSFAEAALIGSVYLAVALRSPLAKFISRATYQSAVYLLVVLVALSTVSFIGVRRYAQKGDVQQRKRLAQYFLAERDNLAEYLLNEVREKISQDAFIRSRLSGPFLNRDAVKQKIKQIYLAGYHTRYKADIYLFSSSGEALEENMQINFSDWLRQQESTAQRTEYEGIYFQRQPNEPSGHYLVIIPVSRESDSRSAFVAMKLSLPRFIPDKVYPELLVDNRYQPRFPLQSVDYAVYYQGRVLISSGGFSYDQFNWSGTSQLFTEGVDVKGYHHVGVEDASGRLAIISRPVPSLTYKIADFSFLLILGLGMSALMLVSNGIREYRSGRSLALVTRLQLLLTAAFFIALITVSTVTLGVTAQALQKQLNKDFQNRSVSLANELAAWLNEGEEASLEKLGDEFLRKMRLTGMDANLFSASGRLLASTQPLIFEYQLKAPVAEPVVIRRLGVGEPAFIADETIGRLQFYAAYAGVFIGDERRLAAFIEIPYFQSQRVAEELQTRVLAQVLTVFLILLTALSVLSLVASQYIVRPLNLIARQLGAVSIGGNNQPLRWMSRDEIGMLVQEYNRMLVKLKQSIAELERTQRERTWREIAQQVAHEIKNPLTPMKLTLQQMQRQVGYTDAALRKSVDVLLEQLEVLNGIATSFSAFAKMPEPVMERVNLVPLLEAVVRLHGESGNVIWVTEQAEAWVNGDARLLSRIFSNLILNALQAERPDMPVLVQVRLRQENGCYRIEVEDNGCGIDDAIRDKIFFPHFSTRKSGSGLGLAIARQGIEQMGGEIGFESQKGRGTIFFIRLPGV
jgi:signal transduction histidine kinase